METISRRPSDYRPTTHFGQRLRERNVPGFAIRECIESGDVKPGDTPDTRELRRNGYFVVLNVENREAVTVGVSGRE